MNEITKTKNPGRVESGRKLAAWNRENKAKLKAQVLDKNLSQEPNQEPSQEPSQKPIQVLSQIPSNNLLVIGIAVAIGGVLWYTVRTQLRSFKAIERSPVAHPKGSDSADAAQKARKNLFE